MSHYLTMKSVGRPVAYFPKLAKYLSSLKAAIFLGQMVFWHEKTDHPLGVYKTSEQIEDETGLSYREQVGARKILTGLGLITETNKRLEHRIYFKFHPEKFDEWLTGIIEVGEQQNSNCPNDKNAFRETTKTQFDIHRIPETTSETTSKKVCAKPEKQQLQNDFELFWTKYPRKVNKKKAFDVFKKIDFKKHPLQTILDSIEKWKGSGLWDDPQYIPHPTTWLNGERWTDEIQTRPVANQNNGRTGYIKQDYQNVDWHAGVDEDGRF